MKLSEEDIVKGCIEGKRKFQQILFEKYANKMLGVCMRYASDREEAEDMMQEGFIKVFQNIKNYRFNGSFEGWVRRVFIFTSINIYREKVRKYKEKPGLDYIEQSFDDDVLDYLSAQELVGLIQQLPEGYRAIFNLYAVEGYTHKEIAEQLGIAIGTSKSQYARAKAYLQTLIKKNEYFEHEQYVRIQQL